MTRSLRALLFLALVTVAAAAHAHAPIQGIGNFWAGAVHPAVVPAHLIAVIALGVWIGQRGAGDDAGLAALLAAVPVGLVFGAFVAVPFSEAVVLALAAVVALAAALAWRPPARVAVGVAVALGIALGVDSQPDGLLAMARWVSLAGTWLGVLCGISAVMLLAQSAQGAQWPWTKVALRVIASWVAAAAVLVLALGLVGPRTKGPPQPVSGTSELSRST